MVGSSVPLQRIRRQNARINQHQQQQHRQKKRRTMSINDRFDTPSDVATATDNDMLLSSLSMSMMSMMSIPELHFSIMSIPSTELDFYISMPTIAIDEYPTTTHETLVIDQSDGSESSLVKRTILLSSFLAGVSIVLLLVAAMFLKVQQRRGGVGTKDDDKANNRRNMEAVQPESSFASFDVDDGDDIESSREADGLAVPPRRVRIY